MKIKPKKNIFFVERKPHWLSSRQGYFTMERNERVDEFPNSFMRALKKNLNSFDLRTYPDTHLIYEEVSRWLKIKNNQLIIHEGADGGLLRVFEVFISGGDRVITCSPSFAMYPVYCKMFGAIHCPIKLKVKNYDYFSELKKKIIKIKPKLVAIANPNQPIEVMLNIKQIEEICKLSQRFGSLVLRVFEVFISGGDRVITCSPSFAMYPVYCKMFGAIHCPIKLKVKNYDYFSELKKKIIKIKPKLVAIANPNQPIEVMLNIKQIEEICKLSQRFGSLVIIDEAYYHFNNITAQPLIKRFKNLIVVRTFSKAFGVAGMRIGYTMSNSKVIGLMLSIKPIYEINAFNMKLVRHLIKNIKVMKKYVKEIHKGRSLLNKFLMSKNIEMIGKFSNTVLFKLDNKKKVDRVIKYLFKNKFIVRPMIIDNDNRYIRTTLGSSKIMMKFNEKLKIALERYN